MKIARKGSVIEVTEQMDKTGKYVNSRMLVVGGKSEEKPLVFKFWGREARPLTDGVKAGDDVEVMGFLEGSQAKDGRWWLNLNGVELKVLGNGAAKDREPGSDDDIDSVPF